MSHGCAGGTGCEYVRGKACAVDLWHGTRGRRGRSGAPGVGYPRQLDIAVLFIRQAHDVRGEVQQLSYDLGRVRWRQQAYFLRHETGGESDGEVVAIRAGIEYVRAGT
jgi:hypothetical protein